MSPGGRVSSSISKLVALSLHFGASEELRSATSDSLPIVVCGNKVDKVEGGHYSKPNTIQDEYYDISVVNCFNFEEPWLGLFRQLLKTPEIVWPYILP